MLRAADIMTRRVFTLPASLSLEGAAWALAHRGVSGAPVLDDDGQLVGVLSDAGDLVGIVTTIDVLRELAAGRISPSRDLDEVAAAAPLA